MQRIATLDAVSTLPTPAAPGGPPGYFASSTNPSYQTTLSPEFVNNLQEEICGVILASGQTLSVSNNAQLLSALNILYRPRLTANLVLYVATTGNDTTGTGTSAAPFLTVQAAVRKIYSGIDFNGFSATINIANGTYTTSSGAGGFGIVITGMPVGMPAAGLSIIGNVGSPSSVVLAASSSNSFLVQLGAYLNLSGVTITASGSATGLGAVQGYGLIVGNGAYCVLNNIAFGTCGTAQLQSSGGSTMICTGAISYTGATVYANVCITGGQHYLVGATITVTGLTMATAFAYASNAGTMSIYSNTFVGTASGPKFLVQYNASIATNGGGTSYLPGSSAGTTSTATYGVYT